MKHCQTLLVLAVTLGLSFGCKSNPEQSKQRYLESGQHYFEDGKYEEATIQFRKALQLDQRFAEAYFRLGISYIKLGQWREAYSALIQAVQLNPEKLEAHLRLGELYLRARDYDNAQKESSAVLEHQPANAAAYQLLGASLVGLGQKQQALEAFAKVTELLPEDPNSYINLALLEISLRHLDAAELHLRKATALDSHFVPAYMNLANFYRLTQRLPEAEQVLRDAVKHNSDDISAGLALNDVLFAEQKTDNADEVLNEIRSRHANSADIALAIGDLFFRRHQMDEASAEYRRGLDIAPASMELKQRMVEYYLTVMDANNAALWNQEVLQESPKDLTANVAQGRILLARGRITDAVALLRQQVNEAHDSPQARYYLAVALWQQGDANTAKSQLQEALERDPDMLPALHALAELHISLGEETEALDYATRSVAQDPKSAAERLLLGTAFLRRGDFTKAREQFLNASQLSSGNSQAHLGLAWSYLAEHKPVEAQRELEEVLEIDPHSSEALGLLSDLWDEQGRRPMAIVRVQQFSKINPGDANAHTILGSLYLRQKEYEAAEAELQRAIQLDPRLVTAYLRLGQIYQEKKEVGMAIHRYEEALALQPDFVPLHVLLGNLYLANGDMVNARNYYERALAISPDFAIAAGNLAWVYAKEGVNLDRAFQLAQRARQVLPQLDSITDTLAWVDYKRGDYDSAHALLEECVRKIPTYAAYRYHLGMVLLAKGEKQKGRDQLEAALRLKLSGEEAALARQALAQLR
jgi:tetratricopeptide (TPR) repeat protein